MSEILKSYFEQKEKRENMGIPPLPLNVSETEEVCKLLVEESKEYGAELLKNLLVNRVLPGVSPSAKIKADFLNKIIRREYTVKEISIEEAVRILGTMLGGYNLKYLIDALKDDKTASFALETLKDTILIYDAFESVLELTKTNEYAKKLIESWANADWFKNKTEIEESIKVKIFKVDGEINTDDFSPASEAWSRPDIPLHALSMGNKRFPGGLKQIDEWRKEGYRVAFVGDVVGTGSSRKSATNSLLWHIGEDIPFVPNKRRGGVVIGSVIAPIFFNTVEDSGGFPITCDVSKLKNGEVVEIRVREGKIVDSSGNLLSEFEIKPKTLFDEFRAGGRIPLIIGKALTDKAKKALNLNIDSIFTEIDNPVPKEHQGFTLAQKIIGKACGVKGVLPGTACEPVATTVGSQDTTGPMTADELTELACLKFQSPMFMQSFCHTAAYPKKKDIEMHKSLPQFISERGGVALKPGDGVIHTWLNRLLIPDTFGTGGDSHTRFPLGISFPSGSGLVAFAGALGFMPLDMPESVLVRFKGKLNDGITLRDAVNAIPYFAIQKGLLTVEKKNKKNIFNGKILEIEGIDDITVEQAFELMDATAERSAAAGTIKLSEESVVKYLESNIALMEDMIKKGYNDGDTIRKRIEDVREWLKEPKLMSADKNAEYAAIIEIDLSDIKEPILCCPNDPDDVKLLSEVAGTKIDDVFVGSCMTNIGHYRAAGKIWDGEKDRAESRVYLTPPTRMDNKKLKEEGYFAVFNKVGARIEIPGCSLCMGNQLRVPKDATVFSTSTRNFDNRMGDDTNVYLGSAELGAVVAIKGELPSPEEYFDYYKSRVKEESENIYKYLQFNELSEF